MQSKVICDWCGKEIVNRDRHGQRNKHHYCSPECASAAKVKKVVVTCDWCGKPFFKKASDANRSQHNFCDTGCYLDYINFEKAGAKNQRVSGKVLYRQIVELNTGKVLTAKEEVHHIDGDHMNSAPENLLVVSRKEHMRIHARLKKRDKHGRFTK